MDCGVDYIKMCEKAEEIQESAPVNDGYQQVGDVYTSYATNYIYEGKYPNGKWKAGWDTAVISEDGEYGLPKKAEGEIWLPRQDQLQEMVTNRFSSREQIPALTKILDFKIKCTKEGKNPSTWEQLWLAFVMKEKYNKTWDGKDWK